jgi:hypothetical protein
MKKNPSLRWTQNLEEKDKEKFLVALRHDTVVLGRLKEILEEELKGLSAKEVSPSVYDSPSWGYKQAHYNGVRQSLQMIISLIPF